MMAKLVLGLDLGPNSIGWALVRDDPKNPSESSLVDLGVRVFPEGVDNFDTGKEKSRNEGRRIARGMRRQIQRRVRRRRNLRRALLEAGLWPAETVEQTRLLGLDPYKLRRRALVEKLSPHELGRIFLHLGQRRGFLSNRKKDRGDKEVHGMLAEINDNEREREAGGFATVGAWLADKQGKRDHTDRKENDHIRNRHLARKQYEDEFEAVWSAQAKHHTGLLTEDLKYGTLGRSEYPCKPRRRPHGMSRLKAFGLHGLVFYQRKMYWPASVVGLCELESKQKRCARSDRHVEQFRLHQEINNLKYSDPETNEELPLDDGQRSMLMDYLATREKATFDQIRKKLGFLESVRFNLERGKRPSIKGMKVDWLMAKEVGKQWHSRSEQEKDAIVRMLLDNERDDDLIASRLVECFDFTPEQAEASLGVDLLPGYSHLSLMAIDKLLPHLRKGLVYQSISDPEQSALHAAGYLRRDELQRRLFDRLPDPKRVNPRDCRLGDIPNPVVKRALVELRKVVNAIIREYGKPDAVHIEMTRSVRMSPKSRSEYNSRIREREAQRERAAEEIRSSRKKVSRDAILKYLLWKEQLHDCVYCGKTISQQQLFESEIDVDHILPYSRCLDDSQMNKVVCHRTCNNDKGQRTPYEWLAHLDSDRYDKVCQHVGSLMRKGLMPYAKYRRFLQKEIALDHFIARQLTDTGYITRSTVEYVRLLFEKDHSVLGLKGQLTSELRWHWGLDTILADIPDSPAWQQQSNLRVGEKNRADHRHHAIDALVIALTNRSRLHQLSNIVNRGGARTHGEVLEDPWPIFRESALEAIQKVNVSHRVERKVHGALHEETLYGPTENNGEWVVRKKIDDLSANEVERIRDDGIRKIVIQRLCDHGIEFGRGKRVDPKKFKQALADLRMPPKKKKNKGKPGVPIKKVRLVKPELTIRPLRAGNGDQAFVKPGSTHHLCIFEYEEIGKTKREAVFVTMLEAMQRIKLQGQLLTKHRKQLEKEGIRGKPLDLALRKIMAQIAGEHPVIERQHPERPDARFVMSLSSREMVLANCNGEKMLLTFKTAASTSGQLRFALHTDARKSSDYHRFNAQANTLDARKVTVDPLGRIRWAND